ncbi:cas scaffolding protein family member 4 isoform X2 [Lacerta agilis]|uniref:cas scaffolding protein family member 4 isoform X2 n=1 Tax=Lacerta agilis TaxID=80427 RepID=UPI001419FE07|nr:cas scaffolding protein family member 4 isoform X2 [Lacerta agilis]
MKFNSTLAKALYDNKAECPDELAFRRGDILTVLDQNLLGSEGWWKCSLHGKQGMAPANRLQLLTTLQAPPSIQPGSPGPPTMPRTVYQVPSGRRPPVPLPVYEKMDGWIMPPPPSSAPYPMTPEVYQVPAMAATLLSEKTQSSSDQHLYTLPRATWASSMERKSDIYDVPSPQHHVFTQGLATPPSSRKGSKLFPSKECYLGTAQQLYDIPLSPEKPRTHTLQESSLENVYVIPTPPSRERDIIERGPQGKHLGPYNTLPNLRKSEWIYDIPVSPEKAGLNSALQNRSPNIHVFYDIPPTRLDSGTQKILPTNNEVKLVTSEVYDVPPVQRKLTLPEIPLYDIPSTHEALVQRQNGNYDVPLGALSSMIEKESHQQTVYDIPRGMPVISSQKKENTQSPNSGDHTYVFPLPYYTDGKRDQDRLSVSSVDSRTSTISTWSSSSTESSSSAASSSSAPSSSSEEPTKEATMELEFAIETLTKLQHSVSSSIASLMIFVSSRWRYQEHLEGNLEEIHRAVDHIRVSLGEFLDFARAIEGNSARSSDSKLHARIKKQLNILTDSFQMLVETREALNNCKWSLNVLVIEKPQNNPDDLDRFVMVARTIPDDIKRFASIIIANGKLLFRKNCKEKEGKEWRVGAEHEIIKSGAEQRKSPGPEQTQPSLSSSKVERKNVKLKIKDSPPMMRHNVVGKEDSTKKMVLSDLCRLYFGAVQKAIGVFHKSLSNDLAPEVFIANSKMIIMVGQKLVDALCQEALQKADRNEILCGSSNFCGLLKNLAVATKNAAIQYPSPEAMKELQNQADGLSKYTQQFRAMME